MSLNVYGSYKPTGFDHAGLGCEEQQDWLVAPCGRNRDSETLTESNYAVQLEALQELDPEGLDHEGHRFGHWACGWFELVLVRPGSPCAALCEGFGDALSDYPILSEEHYSEACMNAESEAWEAWGATDFLRALADHLGEERELYEDVTHEQAFTAWHEASQAAGWATEHAGECVRFNFDADVLDRVELTP